jgi:GDP-L-fucose synthase
LPALIRRFYEAREQNFAEVIVWGSGTPLREFLHVDDLADAALFLMENYNDELPVNVGTGHEVSIRELAELVKHVIEYRGSVRFDSSKPDGAPRKLLDTSRLRAMGWSPHIQLSQGVVSTYQWFLMSMDEIRKA